MTRFLTIDEVAEVLSVHPNTVRKLLPDLGAVDLSNGKGDRRTIRIPETALNAYLRDCVILPPIPARRRRKVG